MKIDIHRIVITVIYYTNSTTNSGIKLYDHKVESQHRANPKFVTKYIMMPLLCTNVYTLYKIAIKLIYTAPQISLTSDDDFCTLC